MTTKEFIKIYSGVWRINVLCPECRAIIDNPLKLFTDCYLGFGVTDDPKLKKACEKYRRAAAELWGLIDDHKFKFIDEDET